MVAKNSPSSFVFKIVLAGEGSVGKTSLRENYMGKNFQKSRMMTIGADFASTQVTVDGSSIFLQIWDLAGQSMFDYLRTNYYYGAHGALLVFDLTRKGTFDNLPEWIEEARKYCGNPSLPTVTLANKQDLENTMVSERSINTFIQELNLYNSNQNTNHSWMYTSALTGLNVKEAFTRLCKDILSSQRR